MCWCEPAGHADRKTTRHTFWREGKGSSIGFEEWDEFPL